MNYQPGTEYYLPQETTALLTDEQLRSCRNLGLILDKYPPQTVIQDSAKKGRWLKETASRNCIDTNLASNVYKRWLRMTTAAGAFHFSATTDWRMVVGLGGETVLETDLTLHHLYGFPYIPASALKGLTRSFAAIEMYHSDPDGDIDHDPPDIKHLFGTKDKAGAIIFFDAMPVDGEAEFALDIMNSHYPNYYGEKKTPTNDQNPNPVTFLTVTNTTFMFALAAREAKYKDDVGTVASWMKDALQKYGVGGKTSAGYGYFKDIRDQQEQAPQSWETEAKISSSHTRIEAPTASSAPTNPDMRKAEGYKRELEAMRDTDVASQIYSYFQKWQQMTSKEARMLLARAIIEKVRKAGREKATAEKGWYKELRTFLEDS